VRGCCSEEAESAENEEDGTPAEVLCDEAAEETTHEASEDGAGNVRAHDTWDEEGGPLLCDVRDGDDEDAGRDEALEEASDGNGVEAGCGGGEERAEGERDHAGDDGALAVELFAEEGKERGGDGDAQGGGADGEADVGLGRVEDVRKEREEWLDAVEIEKGKGAAEEDGEEMSA